MKFRYTLQFELEQEPERYSAALRDPDKLLNLERMRFRTDPSSYLELALQLPDDELRFAVEPVEEGDSG